MMETKFININKDYDILERWWNKRDLVHVPKEMLGPFGFMSYQGDTPVAAAWLCPFVGSNTCMLRFPVSNPEVSDEVRDQGVEEVLAAVHQLAKEMNYVYILCSTNHRGLIKRLKNINYLVDAENCQHLMGVL
jgi:hypothetical protein